MSQWMRKVLFKVLAHPNAQKKEEMFVHKSNAGQKNAENETKWGLSHEELFLISIVFMRLLLPRHRSTRRNRTVCWLGYGRGSLPWCALKNTQANCNVVTIPMHAAETGQGDCEKRAAPASARERFVREKDMFDREGGEALQCRQSDDTKHQCRTTAAGTETKR